MPRIGSLSDGRKDADNAEKRRQALAMREIGYTYDEIAHAMGWKHNSTAVRCVQRALKATYQEPADEVRKLESKRIDRLARAIWVKATGKVNADGTVEPPDLQALDRLLKLMNRRAALLGLDAPIKVKTDVTSKGESIVKPTIYLPENQRDPGVNGDVTHVEPANA